VNLVYLREDAAILAALQSGTVQAAILTSPNTLRAREAGLREIVDTVPLNLRTINTGIAVRQDWAREHEDQVLNFLRAYMEASKVAKTDPEATRALITKYTGLQDPAQLEESYQNSAAGWAISIAVDETLQGRPLSGTQITVFVHSPILEFGLDGTRPVPPYPWVWALKYQGDSIIGYASPGPGRVEFDPADIDHFRRAIDLRKARAILGW
jgi:hypothetical protein